MTEEKNDQAKFTDGLAQYVYTSPKLAAIVLYSHLGGWEVSERKMVTGKFSPKAALDMGFCGEEVFKGPAPLPLFRISEEILIAQLHRILGGQGALLSLHHSLTSSSAQSCFPHLFIDIIPKSTSQ